MSSVHDLSEEVPQVLPRHARIGLQVVEQHVHTDGQVSKIERVTSVKKIIKVWKLRPSISSIRSIGRRHRTSAFRDSYRYADTKC